MARRACLAIGVGIVDPPTPGSAMKFGYLSGAPIAAKNLGEWARSAGFGDANVRIVTDEYIGNKPNPVTRERVQAAVDELFPDAAETVSHLILGFCGHGLTDENIKAISWLFSDSLAQKYRVKADLFYSELLLHGIERLTLVSDACREAPKDVNLQRLDAVRGIVVQGQQVDSPRFDSLVACQDTQLGFMVAEQNNPAKPGKCVFSGVVADALWGSEPSAFDGDRITVRSLGDCLQERTPKVAEKYRLKLFPDCMTNPAPAILYDKAAAPAGPPVLQAWPAVGTSSVMGMIEKAAVAPVDATKVLQRFNTDADFRADVLSVGHTPLPGEAVFVGLPKASAPVVRGLVVLQADRAAWGPKAKRFERGLVGRLAAESAKSARNKASGDVGRSLSQLRTPEQEGRSNLIVAEAGATIWSRHGLALGTRTRAREGFRVPDSPAGAPNLVELSDGRFVPWVPYSGLYTVMKRSRLGDVFQAYGMPIPGMSANFTSGVRTLADFASGQIVPGDVAQIAAGLRDGKHRDPVLGVICAYLYRAVADFDNIRRMAYYYVDNAQPVPFDIVLLGEMKVVRAAAGGFTVHVPAVKDGDEYAARGLPTYAFAQTPAIIGTVGGWCPWLGIGWDYVGEPRQDWAVLVEGLAELASKVQRRGFTWLPKQQGRMLARQWGLGTPMRHRA
ncbi:hypothetical protein LHFGNBLO_006581 (plasmid) [Mesorhizobium sp. AR10]|nr:hypothetical protein LHFGNBLO_006581 [Mesorhizobium sp. AR10]